MSRDEPGEGLNKPSRQCIGCGRRGAQDEFVRLTLDRERSPVVVVPATAGEHPGRGAYLCPRRSCLERAVQRRAFQRAFRSAVAVDAERIAAVMINMEAR